MEREHGTCSLVRMYDDENMLKQYYRWQLQEEHKERFCYTPVQPGSIEYTEEGWLKFRELLLMRVRKQSLIYMLQDCRSEVYLGWISLSGYNFRNRSAEISYYFPAEHRGKGFGTTLLDGFLAIIFADDFYWKLHKIWAETGAFNTASIHLLERAGFRLDGRVRDHYWLDDRMYDQLIYTLKRSENRQMDMA